MTDIDMTGAAVRQNRAAPRALPVVLLALAGAAGVTGLQLAQSSGGGIPNADDAARLVEVRDLLAGQGWFDLTQYRLGLEGGTLMHWSRLVDAPIAAIIRLAETVTGSRELAETIAKALWPAFLLFAALSAIGHGLARTGRSDAVPAAVLIGAVALMTTGVFSPGALDHHNGQVALALWLAACLLPGTGPVRHHGLAGAIAALMLGIGMETLPHVTVAGLAVALGYLLQTVPPAAARAFGLSLAMTAGAILVATVAPARWSTATCDAFSVFHLAMAACGGLGLAATALVARTLPVRLSGLAATGILTGAVALAAFPQCLANPLASLDPRLIAFWLEGVVETRSLADILASDPFSAIGLFGMGTLALAVCLLRTARGAMRPFHAVMAAFLVTALAVTAWQQRGSMFLAAFAILPLAVLVADARMAASRPGARPAATAVMLAAWIASLNISWWMASAQGAALFGSAPILQAQTANASRQANCYAPDLYRPLASEPAGVVLGATDLGASILTLTGHRAVAGPYHRNTAGNLLLIEAMLAEPDAAHALLAANGVTHLAHCPGSADARDFAAAAPLGLQAGLNGGRVPGWLEPVAGTEQTPLVIYRVRPVLPAHGKSG